MNENPKLWALSFFEGGMVMVVELCAAKLLAPYFGTSIQVWAATLALTLGGLALGYFLGGLRARKNISQNRKDLFLYLMAAALIICSIPLWVHSFLGLFLDLPLEAGATLALFGLLIPVLTLLGTTSPLIINLINNKRENAGNTAGKVYAISTCGGILFTFAAGLYTLPYLGIKTTLLTTGMLLGLLTMILLRPSRRLVFGSFALMLLVASSAFAKQLSYNPNFKVLEESDGLLGNIKIIEHNAGWFGQPTKTGRGLVVNNTLQSFMDINAPGNTSIWSWSNIVPTVLSIYPKNSKVLLCGLGGGTIAQQLERLGFDFEVVELDQRIEDYARKYFHLKEEVKVSIDDARHFIRTTKSRYDIVLFDTFLSESAPEHLLTLEALSDVMRILKPNGMIFSNFYGFTSGEMGYAARSVYKTFRETGLQSYVLATPGKETNRNLFFLASSAELDFSKINYKEPGSTPIRDISRFLLDTQSLERQGSEVLYDDLPVLSKLYEKPARSWKRAYNDFYTKNYFKTEH